MLHSGENPIHENYLSGQRILHGIVFPLIFSKYLINRLSRTCISATPRISHFSCTLWTQWMWLNNVLWVGIHFDPINFQGSVLILSIKITSKTQNRLIHTWPLPKLSSKAWWRGEKEADSCLTFLWTHCFLSTYIYFAWPMAEPWKLKNKLLFSKSCQRWLLCQRVDCGTNIHSASKASSAMLLSPQLHTCLQKPLVYLVYVGSPRRCHQSERWEGCSLDTKTKAMAL